MPAWAVKSSTLCPRLGWLRKPRGWLAVRATYDVVTLRDLSALCSKSALHAVCGVVHELLSVHQWLRHALHHGAVHQLSNAQKHCLMSHQVCVLGAEVVST